jgi:hypothetical protein
MGGLEVLVDEATYMKLTERRGDADSQAQEVAHSHGRSKPLGEWLATGVVEQQDDLPPFPQQRQGPRRPGAVERVLKPIFVCETINAAGSEMLDRGAHGQRSDPLAILTFVPATADNTLPVLPQGLEATISLSA